jgi:hypothetical protein
MNENEKMVGLNTPGIGQLKINNSFRWKAMDLI